jgi:CRISPR-associated protein Cas5t
VNLFATVLTYTAPSSNYRGESVDNRIALGVLRRPERHTLYQQLHRYPVGATGQERAAQTMGSKYHIAPVRGALLSGLRGYICARADRLLERQVHDGLEGRRPHRYGLPFLGDNNLLPNRLECVEQLQPARWYVPAVPALDDAALSDVARLSVHIDRADASATRTMLFRLSPETTAAIPEAAWVTMGEA